MSATRLIGYLAEIPFSSCNLWFSQNILQQNGHGVKTKGGRQTPECLAPRTRCFRIHPAALVRVYVIRREGGFPGGWKIMGKKMSKITVCPEISKSTIWDGKLITKESLSNRKPWIITRSLWGFAWETMIKATFCQPQSDIYLGKVGRRAELKEGGKMHPTSY